MAMLNNQRVHGMHWTLLNYNSLADHFPILNPQPSQGQVIQVISGRIVDSNPNHHVSCRRKVRLRSFLPSFCCGSIGPNPIYIYICIYMYMCIYISPFLLVDMPFSYLKAASWCQIAKLLEIPNMNSAFFLVTSGCSSTCKYHVYIIYIYIYLYILYIYYTSYSAQILTYEGYHPVCTVFSPHLHKSHWNIH